MAKDSVTTERRQVPARIEAVLLDRVREQARVARRTFAVELSVLLEEALAARDQRVVPRKSAKQ